MYLKKKKNHKINSANVKMYRKSILYSVIRKRKQNQLKW